MNSAKIECLNTSTGMINVGAQIAPKTRNQERLDRFNRYYLLVIGLTAAMGALSAAMGALSFVLTVGIQHYSKIVQEEQEAVGAEKERRLEEYKADAAARVALANQKAAEAKLQTTELEKQLQEETQKRLGRTLTRKQYDAFQELKGRIKKVYLMPQSDLEATDFATQIANAFMDAGIEVKFLSPPERMMGTGIRIYDKRSGEITDDSLCAAFLKAGLFTAWGDIAIIAHWGLPVDAPVIFVGQKAVERKIYIGVPPP